MNSKNCVYVQKSNCISMEREDMKHSQKLLEKINKWEINCELNRISTEMGSLKTKSSLSCADISRINYSSTIMECFSESIKEYFLPKYYFFLSHQQCFTILMLY